MRPSHLWVFSFLSTQQKLENGSLTEKLPPIDWPIFCRLMADMEMARALEMVPLLDCCSWVVYESRPRKSWEAKLFFYGLCFSIWLQVPVFAFLYSGLCKPINFFLPEGASGCVVYHSNRETIRIFTNFDLLSAYFFRFFFHFWN